MSDSSKQKCPTCGSGEFPSADYVRGILTENWKVCADAWHDSHPFAPEPSDSRTSSLTLLDAAVAMLDAVCSCGPVSYKSTWTCSTTCEDRVARENLRAVIERERHRY